MKYKITFKTGNESGAGTDADVSIQLFGKNAKTDELTLESKLNQFEKGDIDSFYFETGDIGEIERIKVRQNGKGFGSDWFLDYVTIETPSNKLWYFPVYKWIRENEQLTVNSVKHAVYTFEIITGPLPGSGTNEKIKVSLVGDKTYTPFVEVNSHLKENEFITGHTEIINLMLEDVGKIEEIKIKSSGSALNTNWFLSKIKVKKETDRRFVKFPFHCWIKPNGVYSSTKDLEEYTIKFYTGDVVYGGTDANVSMIIYGSRGETPTIRLNELISRNAFEAGNIDYIKIANKDLGTIKKILIWHDEKWLGDGWFLNKISVTKDDTGFEAEFPYYSWLDKSENPKSTKVEINRMPVQPRPFYVISHMLNTPAYVEEALDLGTNAFEFDVMPKLSDDGTFHFDAFHGFRPDFDPDKINLMERSIARTDLKLFLERLQEFEQRFERLSLVIFDCKVKGVKKNKLKECGAELARTVMENFYSDEDDDRIYTIISIPNKRSVTFLDGFFAEIPKKFKKYIGTDLSEENFQTTEKVFEKRTEGNFWWGSGIASTVPKPLKHFIPNFLIAAKKRTERKIIKKIYYWTLDDPDSMARMLVTKLDGIVVNDPLKLLKVLEKEEFKNTYRLATREDDPFLVI